MHLIAALYAKHVKGNPQPIKVELRGYQPAVWVSSEYQLADVALPLNQLAYAACPTSRDLYFEVVEGIQRPLTWERAVGRIVDGLYKSLHLAAEAYCHTTQARSFDLTSHLTARTSEFVGNAIRGQRTEIRKLEPAPSEAEIEGLRTSLAKIVRFEAMMLGSAIEQEIACSPDKTPRQVFDQTFDFSSDFKIASQKLGFTPIATADFLYRQQVIGDIKTGESKPFFDYTMAAYALGYEEEHGNDMDLGAILVVSLPPSRPFPVHKGSRLKRLDDGLRRVFIAMRDHKLRIVAERKDPGRAETQGSCDPSCPFLERCWGEGHG